MRYIKTDADLEEKYNLLTECLIDRVANKKGIDLKKELLERNIFRTQGKSLRKKLREQIYEEMFGKEEEQNEKPKEEK